MSVYLLHIDFYGVLLQCKVLSPDLYRVGIRPLTLNPMGNGHLIAQMGFYLRQVDLLPWSGTCLRCGPMVSVFLLE